MKSSRKVCFIWDHGRESMLASRLASTRKHDLMSFFWCHLSFLSVFSDIYQYLCSPFFSGAQWLQLYGLLLFFIVDLLVFSIYYIAKIAMSSFHQFLNFFVPWKVDSQDASSGIFTICKSSCLERFEYLLSRQFKIASIIFHVIPHSAFINTVENAEFPLLSSHLLLKNVVVNLLAFAQIQVTWHTS